MDAVFPIYRAVRPYCLGSISVLVSLGLALFLRAAEVDSARPSPDPKSLNSGRIPDHSLVIRYPLEATLFPADISPPTFRWEDLLASNHVYQLRIDLPDRPEPMQFVAYSTRWTPSPGVWETIKLRSREKPARFTVISCDQTVPPKTMAKASITFASSVDEVGAPIFYRDVNLPFADAVKDPSDIRWRLGSIAATNPPPVVLEKLPVCGNCHSFSRTGDVMGMDVDYANSKGSYVITRTAPTMKLLAKDIITWDNYRREDGELTFGLLSQVSPDGKVVVSTVKDKSVFVPRPDLAFSQLFFPIKGILAVYERATGRFTSLPGADDPGYVQSNPAWSPDGRFLIFARAKAYDLQNTSGKGKVLLTPAECREFVSEGKPFRFDLYRLPFNGGGGGEAQPLAGASDNGRSNFFPKYSPDGRWIVFCIASNYMLLQPDSELFIIPAEGGIARRLECNLPRMNSWHSWSPNGKWLVFSSKGFSDYTQLFLTHIDREGTSTPPVCLEHFTATNRAANIPEFVNLPPTAIVRMEEYFLDDYSYERAGNEFYRTGDPQNAIRQYRKSLELNPANSRVHQRLGFLLYNVANQLVEGKQHLQEAIRLQTNNGCAHYDLAKAYLNENELELGIAHLIKSIQILPKGLDEQYHPAKMRYDLAQALCRKGDFHAAEAPLTDALAISPTNAHAHYLLAIALVFQGLVDEPLAHYNQAIAITPEIDRSIALHDRWSLNYAQAGQFPKAALAVERALALARKSNQNTYARELQERLEAYRLNNAPP